MATSCCPSWRMMARRLFPEESGNISMTYTPMVYTARLVKKEHPNCKVVFVGPCAAKKLEAMQDDIRTDVDFVLTYEELMGIFEAKGLDFSQLPDADDLRDASGLGRGFAAAGGVVACEVVACEVLACGGRVPWRGAPGPVPDAASRAAAAAGDEAGDEAGDVAPVAVPDVAPGAAAWPSPAASSAWGR